jgi:ABC-2 type transport system permease protein
VNLAIIGKTLRDHWRSTLAWSFGLLGMISLQLYIYPSVVTSSDAMRQYIDAFPEALKTIFRMEDYFSGAGFLGTELFSLMVPLIFISVAAARGSSAIAAEIEAGTADILFTLPISRTRILVSKLAAMVIELTLLTTLTVLSIAIGAKLVSMDISTFALITATSACALMALGYGAIALFAGSLTGKRGVATGLTISVAIAALLFYSLAPIVDTFDYLAPFNPMDWAINGNPLSQGIPAANFVKLLLLFTAFSSLALYLFRNRDIKA